MDFNSVYAAELCHDFTTYMSQYNLRANSILPVYGLAEATLAVTSPIPGEELNTVTLDPQFLDIGNRVSDVTGNKRGITFVDLGHSLQDCRVRIHDAKNEILDENYIGYIVIKGKNVCRGYYEDEMATKAVFSNDGWFNTHDLGFIRSGRLFVTGRAKDLVFYNGINIYLYDIEGLLEKEKEIGFRKVAACKVYNEKEQRDEVVIFINYKKDKYKFISIIVKVKRLIFNNYGGIIKVVIPVQNIPRTTSGKIQRYKLEKKYLEGFYNKDLSPINELNTHDCFFSNISTQFSLEKELMRIYRKVWNKNIHPDGRFFDAGGNSILLSGIVYEIDKRYPNKVNITDLFSYPTISKLAAYIRGKSLLDIPSINLPSFFLSDNYNINSYFQLNLDDKLINRLKEITECIHTGVYHIFAAVFFHLFHILSLKDCITIQLLIEKINFIKSRTIDFSKFSGLIDVIKELTQMGEEKSICYSIHHTDRVLDKIKKDVEIEMINNLIGKKISDEIEKEYKEATQKMKGKSKMTYDVLSFMEISKLFRGLNFKFPFLRNLNNKTFFRKLIDLGVKNEKDKILELLNKNVEENQKLMSNYVLNLIESDENKTN